MLDKIFDIITFNVYSDDMLFAYIIAIKEENVKLIDNIFN